VSIVNEAPDLCQAGPKFFILGGWANPLVEPESLDDITLYD
jgi:hypothetical protein